MRTDESTYDRRRLRQWLAGEARAEGVSRRDLLRLAAAAGVLTRLTGRPDRAAADTPAPGSGIVKPLPPELFTIRGTNAETNWTALRGTGFHTPVDRFFVRNHTSTPRLDAADWRLMVPAQVGASAERAAVAVRTDTGRLLESVAKGGG